MNKTITSDHATINTRINGIEIDTLMGTVTAIKEAPQLGACHFRASNTWLSGNHNRSTVSGFFGAKQEIAHKQTFTMDADEPSILAGDDQGANPVEHLLHALASCLTTSMVAHAAVPFLTGVPDRQQRYPGGRDPRLEMNAHQGVFPTGNGARLALAGRALFLGQPGPAYPSA